MNSEVLDWRTLDIEDEEISEKDISEAESMGKVPVGRYLCECIGSVAKQKDFSNYSCIGAGLKWRIEEVLELNGSPIEDEEGDIYEGRFIFDDVGLYSPDEKDGMRKRRILIAKRTGLISDTSEKITKQMWFSDIIGKRAILTYVDEPYTDKNGKEKTFRKVAFSGYDYADQTVIKPIDEDSFDDI